MSEGEKRPFNQRAFASLSVTTSSLGLAVTGVGTHLCHGGPMTPERHAWMAAHMALAALFVASGVWHAILNGRALLRHLSGAAGSMKGVSREAAWVAGIVALVLLVAVGHGAHGR